VTAVAVVLLHQLIAAPWIVISETWALYATMALTVISGLHYAWAASRRLGAAPANGQRAK